MNKQKLPVLLFDLDGTLLDSAPDLALAVNQTLIALKQQPFTEDQIRQWVGNGAQTLIARALSGTTEINPILSDERIQQALTVFLRQYKACLNSKSRLYDGVADTLAALKERGHRLAIITNKPHAFIAPILAGFALENIFELLIGGDTLAQKKPDPLPLIYACEKLGIPPSQAMMIGDSKNDILAAKAANMKSIALSYGYNYQEDIANYQPDYLLDNFAELLPLLSR